MQGTYDVAVVGAGPGGYVAALRAAQLGLRTLLVEKDSLGGICLNWGCIPTKAMLKGAEVLHTCREASRYGVQLQGLSFDIAALVRHSRQVSGTLVQGVAYLLKKQGVTVLSGTARMVNKGQLEVDCDGSLQQVRARHIVLATGARARALPGVAFGTPGIWSYREALQPDTLPQSLVIAGSGAIGAEFASLYSDLGVQVTLLERATRIMPLEDADVSQYMRTQFEARDIQVHTGVSLEQAAPVTAGVECQLLHEDGKRQRITAERLLLAAGVTPNVEGLGLERLGVTMAGDFVAVDQWCRTNVAGLYAIGDLAGGPCLAHKASHQAVSCIERLAGLEPAEPLDHSLIPSCVYSRPQVASVGLTEQQARLQGLPVRIGRFNLQANGKALASGDASGFVKTVVAADTGEILGAHLVGHEVTEQIHLLALAQQLEAGDEDLARTIFAHPTLSEAIHESMLHALGRPLHQ